MADEANVQSLAVPRGRDRRLLILFFLVGFALVFLLLNLAGSGRTFGLIQGANPIFVLLVLLAQAFRYAASAWSTQTLAGIFDQPIPFFPLYQTMFGGQAMNRTFSVGGAAGMFVRYSFLTRQGLHSGGVAALFLVEDLLGAATIAMVFVAGLGGVVFSSALPPSLWWIAGLFVGGTLTLAAGAAYLYHRRETVEWIVHAAARATSALVARLAGKTFYAREHVERAIDEFYAGVAHSRRDPRRVALSFLFNLLRVVVDAASLYLAFVAIGYAIAPGILLIMFTTASALSTLSGVPGELGVMETTMAVVSTAWGIAPPVAIGAILLFRSLSYWLPIPIGYLACWNLQRRGFI